jgi:prepilin-type N-terminal cleavage/methylation domain-containing protein
MILRKTGRNLKNQRGFTLIEILVAIVITALIGISVSTAALQILKQSVKNRDYTTASQFTMNAIHWISRDAEMAQTIETGGATGFPLTLRWIDWGSSVYQVVYTIENGVMKRYYSHTGEQSVQTVLAESVNTVSEQTTCQYNSKILTVQITATVGQGDYSSSVTSTREIFMRSMP